MRNVLSACCGAPPTRTGAAALQQFRRRMGRRLRGVATVVAVGGGSPARLVALAHAMLLREQHERDVRAAEAKIRQGVIVERAQLGIGALALKPSLKTLGKGGEESC